MYGLELHVSVKIFRASFFCDIVCQHCLSKVNTPPDFNDIMAIQLCQNIQLLPTRASKQGNVIGFVRIYTCVYKKKLYLSELGI